MPRLRRALARAVFLAIGATQGGCCCSEIPDVETDYDRSSPAIAALIDRCEANPDDCEALCRAALLDELGSEAATYEVTECEVTPLADGAHVRVGYYDNTVCGRAPDALLACEWSADGDPVARWLAHAAYLEAASVIAFVRLAADLVRHSAPRALVAAAITAAHDEVRHAAMMRALIRGRVEVPVPRVGAYRPATLRELALSNATEGCARETLGAAINLWQAAAARDPEIRAAFASIAPDEVAHAELAWAIHTWALDQLDAADSAAVIAAHAAAFERLLDEPAVDPATRSMLGLPSTDETRVLAAAIA